MKKVNIFMGSDYFESITGDIIALDNYAKVLIDNNYKNFVCIGDFDSNSKISNLNNFCKVISYNRVKDEGDFELAIMYAIKNNYQIVRVYNVNFGNRLDHLLNNFRIIAKYCDQIQFELIDRHNFGIIIKENTNLYDLGYSYVSFFPLSNIDCLRLSYGFKYRFDGYSSMLNTTLVSNQFILEKGYVELSNGNLLVLFSND